MFLQQTLNVIEAFIDRYLPFVNEQGDYTYLKTDGEKLAITFNNDYTLFVWLEEEELHIENERGESVFDYAEESDWSPEEVNYIRFGISSPPLTK